jgi:hypothetical protein
MPAAMIAATARGAVEALAMGDDARMTPVGVPRPSTAPSATPAGRSC